MSPTHSETRRTGPRIGTVVQSLDLPGRTERPGATVTNASLGDGADIHPDVTLRDPNGFMPTIGTG